MAERLGWIGETRRLAYLSSLQATVQAWWVDWSTLDDMPVCIEGADAQVAVAEWRVGGARVAIGSQGAAALAGALVGVASDQSGALEAYIGAEAIDDLMARIAAGSPLDLSSASGEDALAPGLTDGRLGALRFRVVAGGQELLICVGRRVVDRAAPPASSGVTHLSTRRDASGAARVHLGAQIDLGEISLAELSGLVPGDVLVTDAPLDTLPSIHVLGGPAEPLGVAALGERDDRRALRLILS